jgi:predicted DCC family thiol-disulfide oxidoreductase YuxK
MKTLNNQTLLYDEDCPMCTFYTAAFIKTKMLDTNGRKPFVTLTDAEELY